MIYSGFVLDDLDAAGIVVAFHDKLVRQRIEVDVIIMLPCSQHRQADIFPQDILQMLPDGDLVCQTGILRMEIVELEPVELVAEGLGIFQIQLFTGLDPVDHLQVGFIRDKAKQINELQPQLPVLNDVAVVDHFKFSLYHSMAASIPFWKSHWGS